MNRVTERNVDEDFIDENTDDLMNFSDIKDNGYWAYYDVMEAANTHDALIFNDIEDRTK